MAININPFYNLQVTRFGVFGDAFSSIDHRVFLGLTASAHQSTLTPSLLMSYIYGAPTTVRNITYMYIWRRFFTGDFVS
jgi:hypothetical protein